MRASGVVSSFFTFHCVNRNEDCSIGEEIDVEFVGSNSQLMQSNYHHPTAYGKREHPESHDLKFDTHADFKTYSFEWTRDYLAWYFEGREVRRVNRSPIEPIDQLVNEQSIMMNIWVSKSVTWAGPFDPSSLPCSVAYDWVKHYPWSPDFGISSIPDWTEDFNDPSLRQWYVSSGETFDDSRATFEHGNVDVGNGLLTFYLTPKDYANLQVTGACQQVQNSSSLGTTLYGNQARGALGDFSCYSDVYTEHGVRISPWGGAGRAWFDYGPVTAVSVTVTFQWVDNAWFDDEKAVEVYNWTAGSWERIAMWRGNDGQEHTSSYSISLGPARIGPQQQVRIALYGAPSSVIHLSTLNVH